MIICIVFGGLWSCKSKCIHNCLGVGPLFNNSNKAWERDHRSLVVRSSCLLAFPDDLTFITVHFLCIGQFIAEASHSGNTMTLSLFPL